MANYGQAAIDTAHRRLKPFAAGIDPDDLTAELTQSSLLIRTKYPSIGAYDALTGTDQEWFDTAVGTLTAIMLLGNAVLTSNNGLTQLQTPDFKYTFAVPSDDQQTMLTAQLQQAIGFIASVRSGRASVAAATSVFGVAGKSRTRQEAGRSSLPHMIQTLLPSGWGGDRPASVGITPGF